MGKKKGGGRFLPGLNAGVATPDKQMNIRLNQKLTGLGLLLMLWGSLSACTPKVIRGTRLRATPRNLKVVGVVRRYEGILRSGNWPRLMSMLSPTYKRTYFDRTLKKKVTIKNRQVLLRFFYKLKRQKFRFHRLKMDIVDIRYPSLDTAYALIRYKSTYYYPRGKYRPGLQSLQGESTMVLQKVRGSWLIQKGGM